jgi:hypothetical protein
MGQYREEQPKMDIHVCGASPMRRGSADWFAIHEALDGKHIDWLEKGTDV